jgi:hypothetical protein
MDMSTAGAAVLALCIATIVTALELATTKYPRTCFVLTPHKCLSFYLYSFLYGAIAMIIVGANLLHLEKYGLNNPWSQALAVGLTVKSLLHIRLFSIPKSNVPQGNRGEREVVPIGLETIIFIIEPWLLRSIELDEFIAVQVFLAPWLKTYSDPDLVRELIETNLPTRFMTDSECAFLLNDLRRVLSESSANDSKKVQDALEIYLRYLGRKSLHQVFPLSSNKKQRSRKT